MPLRKVTFNYEVNGIAKNAYSVQLKDQSGINFGIKDILTNIAVVPPGTSVDNPKIGLYTYQFDADDTKTYVVAWNVVQKENDVQNVILRQVGPFSAADNFVRADDQVKGQLIQGTTATVTLQVASRDGMPLNASTIDVSVYDPFGAPVVMAGRPDKLATGLYAYDWDIPSLQSPGQYEITWRFVTGGVTKYKTDTFIVTPTTSGNQIYSPQIRQMLDALQHYICCAQHIPVYFQQSKPTRDNQSYQFSFPRWNTTDDIILYRNKGNIVKGGYSIDYSNGVITFDDKMTSYDMLFADYNFKWFSDQDLLIFLQAAVAYFNIFPPQSRYSLTTVPSIWMPIIVKQAAVDAIRKLMFCLQFQQPQQVFGGEQAASKAFSNLETLKKNYQQQITKAMQQKKLGPYTGLFGVIRVDTVAMPGGRSRFFRQMFTSNSF